MSAPSNNARSQGLRKIAWLHFKFLAPSDWEPVAFSSHPKEGRLEFANRDGHLARVAWLQCKETPDIAKMMDEFHKVRLKERDKEALKAFSGLSFRQAGAFRFGIHKPGSPCQAAVYHQIRTSRRSRSAPSRLSTKGSSRPVGFRSWNPIRRTPATSGNGLSGAWTSGCLRTSTR